jgi:hypothetical protein
MGFTLTCALFVLVPSVQGNDASDFGTSGLIRMPSARMAEDSTLRATIAVEEVANLYNITFQALPKVQATFRYAIFNPNNLRGSNDNLRDRSYEIKAEVLAERYLIPQIAIGARDVLGTGAWEGEYLVASKKWKSFDVSVGHGLGTARELAPDFPIRLALYLTSSIADPEALAVLLVESPGATAFFAAMRLFSAGSLTVFRVCR